MAILKAFKVGSGSIKEVKYGDREGKELKGDVGGFARSGNINSAFGIYPGFEVEGYDDLAVYYGLGNMGWIEGGYQYCHIIKWADEVLPPDKELFYKKAPESQKKMIRFMIDIGDTVPHFTLEHGKTNYTS